MSSDNNEEEEIRRNRKDSLSLLTQQSKGQSHFPPKKSTKVYTKKLPKKNKFVRRYKQVESKEVWKGKK